MEFQDYNGSITKDDSNIGLWDWGEEDYCQSTDYTPGGPQCLWDYGNQNENDSVLYMLGDQTPIKDCGDFNLDALGIGGETNKRLEECRESSLVKRRRMLQFTSDADNTTTIDQQPTSAIDNSKAYNVGVDSMVVDGLPESLESDAQLYSDDRFLFSNEVLDQSMEGWLENYFNETEMHDNSNEMCSSTNDYVNLDDQTHVTELCNITPERRTSFEPKPPRTSTLKIFKGTKSLISSRTKLTTSVATSVTYPFTLIKPCDNQGNLTLKDINQRIHAPPPKTKHNKDADPYLNYPTSAFSGKPVVAKTKIRTEGGKGSITILRTKG